MIEIPPDAVEQTLVAFVRRWFKLLSAGRWEEACDLIDEPNCWGIVWTPERIKQVVANTFRPGCRFMSRHPEGIRWTDPDELGEGGCPDVYLDDERNRYQVDHDVPLNGEWSDLTAQFEFHRRPGAYAVVLHDLHVL